MSAFVRKWPGSLNSCCKSQVSWEEVMPGPPISSSSSTASSEFGIEARQPRSRSNSENDPILSTSVGAIIVKEEHFPKDAENLSNIFPVSSVVDGISDEFCDEKLAVVVENPNEVFERLLQAHCCYHAIPKCPRIIVFDVNLPVKKAFYALVYNNARAAMLWDAKLQKIVGILSITDFIRILLTFDTLAKVPTEDESDSTGDAEDENVVTEVVEDPLSTPEVDAPLPPNIGRLVECTIDEHQLGSWREILKEAGKEKALISINADESLFLATEKLITRKIHRLPVIDPVTQNPIYILTYKRILHFLWVYRHTLTKLCSAEVVEIDILTNQTRPISISSQMLRPVYVKKSPKELGIGVWGEKIITVSPNTSLLKIFRLLLEKDISGVPVVKEHRLLDMYTRFDAIGVAVEGKFDKLRSTTVEQSLGHRRSSVDFEGAFSCLDTDSLETIIEELLRKAVHRIAIVDSKAHLVGLVAVSDIIRFLVLSKKTT